MINYEIYKITNTINNKMYIGYTNKGIENRLHKHYTNAIYGIDTHFYRAIRKYGIDKFKYICIDNADNISDIKNKEIYWIKYFDTYKNGYNMTIGGDGGNIVDQLSPEKYQVFIDKKIEQTTGDNNPRYSGHTDQQIVEYAISCYIENDFNWILSKWISDYCNKYNIPKSMSKFRFNGKGMTGMKELMILKLNEVGYNIDKIKYKQTENHCITLSLIQQGKKWYHNDKLKQNKTSYEPINNEWVLGRKKY